MSNIRIGEIVKMMSHNKIEFSRCFTNNIIEIYMLKFDLESNVTPKSLTLVIILTNNWLFF